MVARGWFTVRVELISGRGEDLDPRPGRLFLVGPRHTLEDLAVAIDLAFARWDLAHLHMFEFSDGRRYALPDEEYGQEFIDYRTALVSTQAKKGEPFRYVFDFGDEWLHSCVVTATGVDPEEAAGIVPRNPIPIWGWGWIPDQHGRRTETGDEE